MPGFKHIVIKPNIVGDLTSARAAYDSVRGPIVSDWKINDGAFILNVTIPANTTATVYLPAKDPAKITERGNSADKAEGVQFLRVENGRSIFEIGSGTYNFTVRR
jgi:hypothetical protein